jgi:hypothetical protein
MKSAVVANAGLRWHVTAPTLRRDSAAMLAVQRNRYGIADSNPNPHGIAPSGPRVRQQTGIAWLVAARVQCVGRFRPG